MSSRESINFSMGPAILFCPGDRPDRFNKALDRADALILDLEDAVTPERKALARETVRQSLTDLPLDRTVVRINQVGTPAATKDLEALCGTGLRYVMVPKVESASDVAAAAGFAVIALLETARGVEHAWQIATSTGCVAMSWGAEDLTADMGGTSSRRSDGSYLTHVDYTRGRVLIACRAAGVTPLDGTFLHLHDQAGLMAEAREAVAMGYAAKLIIHPDHAPIVRCAYQPSAERVHWAQKVVAAVSDGGVTQIDGQMIDGPLLGQAERILAAAQAGTSGGAGPEVDEQGTAP